MTETPNGNQLPARTDPAAPAPAGDAAVPALSFSDDPVHVRPALGWIALGAGVLGIIAETLYRLVSLILSDAVRIYWFYAFQALQSTLAISALLAVVLGFVALARARRAFVPAVVAITIGLYYLWRAGLDFVVSQFAFAF